MNREEWKEEGKKLLQGIFESINDFSDPVVVKRSETEITYPHKDAKGVWREVEERAERFEGLTRSLFIAAPLIKEEPELQIEGFRIADYYRSHILRSVDPEDELYIGTYQELKELTGNRDPFAFFQETVETCALVIGLYESGDVLWESYTQKEKDRIAAFLHSYAEGCTVPQNWRLFNMLDLAFLDMKGYPIDHEIMRDHAGAILEWYAGDGWYRDGHSFDYYSCWAFQVYGPIWCRWYGYEKMPRIAERIEEYSNKLMETYADFFDADGWTNMWGRSNIYRFASVSAFAANFLLKHPVADPGRARFVASGSLKQFMDRDDFLPNGIPTLGFYGQFAPLIQGYSCAESPFWIGKAFLALSLGKDHPFWTEEEHRGTWDLLKEGEVKVTVLDAPGLCFSNHEKNGSTILRTGKVVKNKGDLHGICNYGKLAYHTKYPWDASLVAMQYELRDLTDDRTEYANVCFWGGEKDGILYRKQFFEYDLSREAHWIQAIDLADLSVSQGILRADRLRLHRRPIEISLGSFGFPDNGTKEYFYENENAKAIVLKGYDSQGRKKRMAMTVFSGWDDLKTERREGKNPDSRFSLVIRATAGKKRQYGGEEEMFLISQVITGEDHEDFTEDELFPIREIRFPDEARTAADIVMTDGSIKKIDYAGLEGRLML